MPQIDRSAIIASFASGTFLTEDKLADFADSYFNLIDDAATLGSSTLFASGASAWTVDNASGHFIPTTSSAQDIGSSALPIRSLFMSGSSLHIGGARVLFASAGNVSLVAASTLTLEASTISISSANGVLITASSFMNLTASTSMVFRAGTQGALTVTSTRDMSITINRNYTLDSCTYTNTALNMIASAGAIYRVTAGDFIQLSASAIRVNAPITASTDLQISANNRLTLSGSELFLTASTSNVNITGSRIILNSASIIHNSALAIRVADFWRLGVGTNTKINLTASQVDFTNAAGAIILGINASGNLVARGSADRDLGSAASGFNALFVSSITSASQNLDLCNNVNLRAGGLMDLAAPSGVRVSSIEINLIGGDDVNLFADQITIRASNSDLNLSASAAAVNIAAGSDIFLTALDNVNITSSALTWNGRDIIGLDYTSAVAPGAVAQIITAEMPDGTDFVTASANAQFWQLFSSGTDFYVWYSAGSAIDPLASGTGIQVSASTTDSSAVVASNTASAISVVTAFNASVSGGNDSHVIVTNASTGFASQAVDITASVTFSGSIIGSAGDIFALGFDFAATSGGKTFLQVYNNGIKQMEGATKNWVRTDASTVTFNVSAVPAASDDVEFYGFGV